jgi:hypothetical protein
MIPGKNCRETAHESSAGTASAIKHIATYGNPGYHHLRMAKKLATTIYITESQNQLLKELNRRSKVPVAEYIREGIDLVLAKHKDLLPGQLELQGDLIPGAPPERKPTRS